MKQLAMKWAGGELPAPDEAPGVTIRSFQEGDLADLAAALEGFDPGKRFSIEQVCEIILDAPGVFPAGIFLAYGSGGILGTATGRYLARPGEGELHMVSVTEGVRGRKLGRQLCLAAMRYLTDGGCTELLLTTDDFRLAAVKTYLDLGFLPVLWDGDMRERWGKVLGSLGIPSVRAYADEQAAAAAVVIAGIAEDSAEGIKG